jgi:hypothetical protein
VQVSRSTVPVLFLALVGGAGCHSDDIPAGWDAEWEHPGDGVIKVLWGTSTGDIWAGGETASGGTLLLHSTGNGQWLSVDIPVNQEVVAGWSSSPTDVYVMAQTSVNYKLLHSIANCWEVEWSAQFAWMTSIWGAGPTDVYAALNYSSTGGAGGVYHSAGDGRWVLDGGGDGKCGTPSAPADCWLSSVWGTDAAHIYATSSWDGLFERTPQGWLPTTQNLGDVVEIGGSGPADLYVASAADSQTSLVDRSVDGVTWTLDGVADVPVSGLAVPQPRDPWLVGSGNHGGRVVAGGAYDVVAQTSYALAAIWATPTDVWVGGDGHILHRKVQSP